MFAVANDDAVLFSFNNEELEAIRAKRLIPYAFYLRQGYVHAITYVTGRVPVN